MNRSLIVGALGLALLCVGAAITPRDGEAAGRAFAHNVYFALKDSSPETRAALVAACEKYLSGHDGTVSFAAGTRAREMTRDVNDVEFDVSLHIYFEDEAAHAAYQKHPRHQEFIAEMNANWKAVRVFDSRVTTRP
jgi:heme-degrading monooxygenase HmoA